MNIAISFRTQKEAANLVLLCHSLKELIVPKYHLEKVLSWKWKGIWCLHA